jgi:hypothetical protein
MKNDHSDQTRAGGTPPGFPGHRTRSGRSGLDYIDNAREFSFMEGKFYRNLFTGRLRTRNPFYLGAMLILGMAMVLPMLGVIAAILGATRPDYAGFGNLSGLICPGVFLLFLFAAGAALLVNFTINVWQRRSLSDGKDPEETAAPRRPSIRRKARYRVMTKKIGG